VDYLFSTNPSLYELLTSIHYFICKYRSITAIIVNPKAFHVVTSLFVMHTVQKKKTQFGRRKSSVRCNEMLHQIDNAGERPRWFDIFKLFCQWYLLLAIYNNWHYDAWCFITSSILTLYKSTFCQNNGKSKISHGWMAAKVRRSFASMKNSCWRRPEHKSWRYTLFM
jgi:hypothetical protein